MEGVKVHRNSAQPAQFQALAFAKGNDIHLGPGQDKHLEHEAWHVVQQKAGRVRPTTQLAGSPVNTDPALEKEADIMGAKAANMQTPPDFSGASLSPDQSTAKVDRFPVQKVTTDQKENEFLNKPGRFLKVKVASNAPIQGVFFPDAEGDIDFSVPAGRQDIKDWILGWITGNLQPEWPDHSPGEMRQQFSRFLGKDRGFPTEHLQAFRPDEKGFLKDLASELGTYMKDKKGFPNVDRDKIGAVLSVTREFLNEQTKVEKPQIPDRGLIIGNVAQTKHLLDQWAKSVKLDCAKTIAVAQAGQFRSTVQGLRETAIEVQGLYENFGFNLLAVWEGRIINTAANDNAQAKAELITKTLRSVFNVFTPATLLADVVSSSAPSVSVEEKGGKWEGKLDSGSLGTAVIGLASVSMVTNVVHNITNIVDAVYSYRAAVPGDRKLTESLADFSKHMDTVGHQFHEDISRIIEEGQRSYLLDQAANASGRGSGSSFFSWFR